MAPPSPRVVVKVDLKQKPSQQNQPLHNRWHPEIPSVAEVKAGEFFRVEMVDCMGGNVKDNDSASDVKNADFSTSHYLSGPIRVVDEDGVAAKPGDLLVVEICNLGPLPGDEWGYTASLDRENGGGFLTDHFPCATKAIWYFEGIYAYSPQIPGVRFPGLTHPGVIGTAPSMELLRIWNERERQLEESGLKSLTLCEVVHQRPLANLPKTKGCLLGNIKEGTPEWERMSKEAARTIPGRENGGNCDIKNLSRGSKIYLPVFVEGANLSTGDMHFSQGDGEISFCGAIEMSGFLELKCEIIRNGMQEYLTPMGPTPLHVNPIFEIGPVEPRFSEWLVFEGISVDESGRQHYLDATVAFKRAVLNAIDYLFKFGYSKEQVYLLLSCCPCEGRISGIVDSPNAVATLAIPTAIFDQVHYLSGPIKVVDEDGVAAKPGDLLAVEICNLGPLPGDEWGFTGSFDRENGGGFLTDHFPCATKAIWYFEGIYAYSPQIPGVRFPGLTHPGIIGTAPSKELLRIWNERERQLEESGVESLTLCEVVHQRPLASLPTTKGCLLGNIEEGTPEWERIAKEAARTIPGRENGGNCDIKNLSRGSKIYLPVFVEGANLSTGDMHFSQGDGEISFCGAIEMSGFLELKCEIIRNGMQEYLTPMGPTPLHVNPIFEIGPVEPRFSEWLVFEGISVDESGRQHYLDATVAYKRAVLNAIDYLFKFGYSKEQVYLLLSCCPCEGRISGIVDSPNAVATLAIPTAIFDQDIRPKTQKVPVGPRIVKKPDVMKSAYDGKLPITKNPSSSS